MPATVVVHVEERRPLAVLADDRTLHLVAEDGSVIGAARTAELPDLPGTKALVLQGAKRTVRIQPYSHWLEDNHVTNPILLCPNTTWDSKHWPEEHWVKFIDMYSKCSSAARAEGPEGQAIRAGRNPLLSEGSEGGCKGEHTRVERVALRLHPRRSPLENPLRRVR